MHRRRAVWPRPWRNKEKGRLYLTHLNNSGDRDDIQLSLSVYKQFVVFFIKEKQFVTQDEKYTPLLLYGLSHSTVS